MGWLKRLFGLEKPPTEQPEASGPPVAQAPSATATATIPLERVGLNGEYDQNGLAKRVALAFDRDPEVDDIETIYVAQLSSTVVLKGKAPSQEILTKLVAIASGVSGATNVQTDQVAIG